MVDRIWRAYGKFLELLGLIAGMACLAMMTIVALNVAGRYLFNTPLPGAFEVSQSLLTLLIFFSIALTQHQAGHIQVVFLTRKLSPRVQQILQVVTFLISAIVFGLASYATFGFAYESYLVNEQEWGSIRYPLYPVKFFVFFGLLLLTVQFLLDAIRAMIKQETEIPSMIEGEY